MSKRTLVRTTGDELSSDVDGGDQKFGDSDLTQIAEQPLQLGAERTLLSIDNALASPAVSRFSLPARWFLALLSLRPD